MSHPTTSGVERKVRRLFWDIETSPNVVYTWRIGFKLNLGHNLIIRERKVICICWKWEDDPVVHELHWDHEQDDRSMLVRFAAVANEADELVAHYGDGFDMPWFRTRCLIHGLTPLPAYKTIDTKAWASKYFYFNSNKLDYLGQVLGHGKKLETDWKLWEDVMKGSERALAYMIKYNKQDVRLLEKVYKSLKFCVAPKTHAGVFSGKPKWTCAHCGSEDVKKSKTKVTASGVTKHQMHCHACHSYYTINSIDFEAYLHPKPAQAAAAKPQAKACRSTRVATY